MCTSYVCMYAYVHVSFMCNASAVVPVLYASVLMPVFVFVLVSV